MAKAKTAKAPKKKTKAGKTAAPKGKVGVGKKLKSKTDQGFEALVKLADHPLVADLLAVGAMAAVAAIAEQGFSSKSKSKAGGSSRAAVKAAGTAAAAAIGKRLITEFEEVKKASKPVKAKAAKVVKPAKGAS